MKISTGAAALIASALLLAGCSSDDAPATPAGTSASGGASSTDGSSSAADVELVAGDTLTVCTNAPFEPFEFEENGEIVGFDMDITGEVAKDLGVDQEVINVAFDAMESGAALTSGQCDIAAAGISINDERAQNVDFSDPYFDADLGLLAAADAALTSEDALAGKTVAVQIATVGEDWAEAKGLEAIQYADLGLQVQALKTGQVDAVINDVFVLGAYEGDGFGVTATFPTEDRYGLAVAKGNTALLEAINATLDRIEGDGTYATLYEARIGVAHEG